MITISRSRGLRMNKVLNLQWHLHTVSEHRTHEPCTLKLGPPLSSRALDLAAAALRLRGGHTQQPPAMPSDQEKQQQQHIRPPLQPAAAPRPRGGHPPLPPAMPSDHQNK